MPRSHAQPESHSEHREAPVAGGEKADPPSEASVAGASVVHVAILSLSPFLLLALLIFLDGLIRP